MDTKELIHIPEEFAQYEIRQTDPTGKSGVIRLVLENDHDKNKTVIKEQYSQAPLYTQRALYYDTANPSMAYLFLISSSGGILQDDRYQVDVLLQNGAMANITTQGATRIYKMDSGFAVQDMNITVGDGCYLELVPDQIIPYKNSRYCQRVNITISDDATLVYSELVTPGRVAMGELFDYDICYLRTVVRDKSDKLKLIDTSMLRPKEQNLQAMGLLDNSTVFGILYILTKSDLVEQIHDATNALLENTDVHAGCSILPQNCGIIIRILGNSTEDIKTLTYQIVALVRKMVLNSSFSEIRKT